MPLRIIYSVLAIVLTSNFAALAQTAVPSMVNAHMRANESCGGNDRLILQPGFFTRKDVNGDKIDDFILDYGQTKCPDGGNTFCGTAGCLTTVFVSKYGRHVKVLDENVQDVRFQRVKKRPAMILNMHGSACGRAGASACKSTLFWNGEKFSPAN